MITETYGGNTVTAELACITDVIPTPTSMFSAGRDQADKRAGIMHDVESPAGDYARPLARGWLRSGEPHSIHAIIDGFAVVQLLRLLAWCWGAGPKVNTDTVQFEQAGYTTFTKAMWLGTETTDGTATYRRPDGTTVAWTALMNQQMAAQFVNVATFIAQVNIHFGWGIPRWGTESDMSQYLAGSRVGCWFTHWMVSNWAGGTNHTDPYPQYPMAEIMLLAGHIYGGKPDPITPPTASPEDPPMTDDDKTWLVATIKAAVHEEVAALRSEVIKHEQVIIAREGILGQQNSIVKNHIDDLAAAIKASVKR